MNRFLLLATASVALAQTAPPTDPWAPLRPLAGSWEGASAGKPGQGKVRRDYQFVMNSHFLRVENKSVYPAQEMNPKGEVHEDWGLFSYDRGRKKLVLRQFHVEGFVNTYVLDTISRDGKTLIFVTESIENIPPGWKARETYTILNDHAFTEVFELAEPGKEFEVYSESRLKRVSGK
jgi:hypothetical protein